MVAWVKNEFYTDGDYITPKVLLYENMQTAIQDMFRDVEEERSEISVDEGLEISVDEGIDGTKLSPVQQNSFWELRFQDKDGAEGILLWDVTDVPNVIQD